MKHTIWSNINLDYEDWRADLEMEYPDEAGYDEYDRIQLMHDINAEYLEDERINLDSYSLDSNAIIALGDLGFWNGRTNGYKIIQSDNLGDCLVTECPMAEWYVENGELKCTEIHHDGRNYIRYRAYKANATDEEREALEEHILDGTATEEELNKLTDKLGPCVAQVYGWAA